MSIGQIGAVGRLGLTQAKGVPWWAGAAHLVDGASPGFFLDVLNGRYALGGASRSLADLLTVTNASAIRTYIDQSGVMRTAAENTPRFDWSNGVRELLLEGASTNRILNSAMPSTQSVTTIATTYTLSFYGAGAITCSGTSTGTTTGSSATTRTSVTFAATAGTLTLTISGSVTLAQLEVGIAPTSYIPTTTTTVTRTADLCQLSASAAAVLQGAGAAVAWRGGAVEMAAFQTLLGIGPTARGLYLSNGNPAAIGIDSPAAPIGIAASAIAPSPIGAAFGWGASGRRGASMGQAAVSSSTLLGAPTTMFTIGSGSGMTAGQILRVRQLVGWSLPDRPSASSVQGQARDAA